MLAYVSAAMSSSHTLKQNRVNRRKQYMKLKATGRMQIVCNASVTNEFPCLSPTYCCYQEADIQISSTMQRWGTEQKIAEIWWAKRWQDNIGVCLKELTLFTTITPHFSATFRRFSPTRHCTVTWKTSPHCFSFSKKLLSNPLLQIDILTSMEMPNIGLWFMKFRFRQSLLNSCWKVDAHSIRASWKFYWNLLPRVSTAQIALQTHSFASSRSCKNGQELGFEDLGFRDYNSCCRCFCRISGFRV
jgi:hypothetical protein